MNLIIPLKNNGSYDQLRFALRSITSYHNITKCIIVGGLPLWYTGDHIKHKDYDVIHKEHNIRDKVLAAVKTITGTFIFANDDHILLKPITKIWDKGLLKDCLTGRASNGSYTRCLRNTYDKYGNVPNVDTHCPMFMDSDLVEKTNFDWPDFGIGFKTCYAQENNIGSTFMPDCKVSSLSEVRSREWFSMRDNFDVKKLLPYLPQKSKFEK